MSQITLPAVAKSFYTFCKKCDAERYHTVLSHKTSTSARVQCEVCKSIKTYSLPKAGSTVKKAGTTGSPAKERARKATHSDQFQLLSNNRSGDSAVPFSIKTKFELNQKIQHATFGTGFVQAVQPDRIEVLFESEVKTLMHNKV